MTIRSIGAMALLAGLAVAAQAGITGFQVTRTGEFTQSGPGMLSDLSWYNSFQVVGAPGDYTVASVTEPDTDVTGLSVSNGIASGFSTLYPTQAALDAGSPVGAYTISLSGGALGAISGGITQSGLGFAGNVPKFNNFNAIKAANRAAGFSIEFDGFGTVAGSDFNETLVLVVDKATSNYVVVASLANSATSYNVAPGLLDPFKDYTLFIGYRSYSIDRSNLLGGAAGLESYLYYTRMELEAAPEPFTLGLLGLGLAAAVRRRARR